jgi:hypothetical protein
VGAGVMHQPWKAYLEALPSMEVLPARQIGSTFRKHFQLVSDVIFQYQKQAPISK